MSNPDKYRLVTRSDFDGLICAVLLKELNLIDGIQFVHPKDMQDGIVDISDRDITTNLPYVESCYLCFDHHASEAIRLGDKTPDNHIIDAEAPSTARVVHNHYGGKEAFPNVSDEMMAAVDKADSAQFSQEEILDPIDWVLLNYLMDSRTGLGRFKEFRVSNYQLMMQLIDCCRDLSIKEILALPDVAERIDLYNDQRDKFVDQIKRCTTLHKNLVVLDLTNEETIFAGNRFMIYALFPQCNISIHKIWGLKKQNMVYAIGKSILDRSSKTNIGELCLSYGGGGHSAAGTCQIPVFRAEIVLQELVDKITQNG